MEQPKLTYFAVTALAEPIRFILSYSKTDFNNYRINRADWPKMKPTIPTPFGKLPILEIDGHVLWESVAICRYLAKKANLVGDSEIDSFLIDATVDTITDLRTPIAAYHYSKPADKKPETLESLNKEHVPFYLDRLEKQLSENKGYFVAGKLTWADLYFAAIIDYISGMAQRDIIENYPQLKGLKNTVLEIPSIKSWIEKRPNDPPLYKIFP